MNYQFNLPFDIKLPTLFEARQHRQEDLETYIRNLRNRGRKYGAMHPRRNSMKYLLSRLIPVHFTASYYETMGTNEANYEVKRTSKWWGWRDHVYRHFVSA